MNGGEWAIAILVAAALVVVLWRWAKHLARRYRPQSPEDQLVGLVGEVVTSCHPEGQVRVRGEIWKAVCAAGAAEGTAVRVERVESFTLVVTPTS